MKVGCNFVKAYSKLFDYLAAHDGIEEVDKFCELFADTIGQEMTERVKARGLSGAFEYWSYTLAEEGADCDIILRCKEGKSCLEIRMHDCPSLKHLEIPNKIYCKHCDTIYRHLLKPMGFDYYIEYDGRGKCRILITELSS